MATDNIVSRVTGGVGSAIFGTLRSGVGKANVYLVNPAGLVFGETANVDVRGAFHATTAESIEFEGGEVFEGYTELGNEPGVQHVGRWAHARRKFDQALRGQGGGKKKGTKKSAKESKARQALSQIQALYAIERTLKDVSVEERYAVRQERSRPLIEKLRQWLDKAVP